MSFIFKLFIRFPKCLYFRKGRHLIEFQNFPLIWEINQPYILPKGTCCFIFCELCKFLSELQVVGIITTGFLQIDSTSSCWQVRRWKRVRPGGIWVLRNCIYTLLYSIPCLCVTSSFLLPIFTPVSGLREVYWHLSGGIHCRTAVQIIRRINAGCQQPLHHSAITITGKSDSAWGN